MSLMLQINRQWILLVWRMNYQVGVHLEGAASAILLVTDAMYFLITIDN
jgi:hypothetical protein